MYFHTSRFTPILAVLAALAFASPALADPDIFGEPLYWGFASDFGTVAGDFDGDGHVDLFTVHPPVYDSFGILIYPGDYRINFNTDGQGSFSTQTLIDSSGAYAVFASDLNNDGALDVIDDDIGVMLGNGDGTFGPIIEYSNGHGTSHALGFGDMDNDGDIDIVAPNTGPVLLNNGDGTFYTNYVHSDVAGGIGVGIGDVDEDGVLDIVSVDGYDPVVTIQLGLGDGQGNPDEPYTVNIGQTHPSDMALIDMNNDGHLDVVTLNEYPTDNVTVILGDGDGTFGSPATYEPHDPANFNVEVFKVADVSGDGAPEVAVTSIVYGNAEHHYETGLLLNDGDGGLTLHQTIVDFGQGSENIVAADLNDDGNTDLANATHLLFNQLPATIGMGVQPLDDFFSIGPDGGPFDPPSKTYTLTNNEDFSIEYSAGADADWLTIDNTGGMIPAGGSVDVNVSINADADSLPRGDYGATVSLVNLTNHHGDRTRDVTLQVGIEQVIYSFSMDSDPGWQTEGDWAFGQPTGQGGAHGSPDPTSGYTGTNVYGYNLNGDYPYGLWDVNLTTGPIDCSNLSHVTLRFRRWLGVNGSDHTYVRVSTDGDFFLTVWFNQDAVYDSDWQLVEYDISGFADGEPTVYLQWSMGVTYSNGACGWNIDDVQLWGVDESVSYAGLHVYPAADYAAQGPQGGPFDPPFKHYTVKNDTHHDVDYSVTKTADWITLDNATGTLPPAGAADVTVHINSNANDLPPGRYDDTLVIYNETDGTIDTTRAVSLGLPEVVYSFPLDSDPGWQTEGLWAFGQPAGLGGQHGNPDPTSGYTGANVYGYNLYGDYENNLPETNLTTTAIDCSNLSFVTLRFRRWLNLEEGLYDHGYVRVSNDGVSWTDVWENEEYVTLEENTWHERKYEISSVADGQSTVFIRWTMGATGNIWQYSGWNIDDVEILGVEPDGRLPGDLDCNGSIDFGDINPFVLALTDRSAYEVAYPDCSWPNGDIDGNGDVNFDDINPFVELLAGL